MFINFLPQMLIMVGFVGGLVILIRRARTLSDKELRIFREEPHLFTRLREFWQQKVAEKFPKEELEYRLLHFAEKVLRKIRILVIRFDSFLSRLQHRFRELKHSQNMSKEYWGDVGRARDEEEKKNAKVAER